MFDDLWPLSHIAYFVLFGAGGAAAGWWVEIQIRKQIRKQSRRRRLKKLGFSADDFESKERFLKRFGEVCVAKIPQKISLQAITAHSWSKPIEYEQSKAALEALGFQRTQMFVASPMDWIAEFWLGGQPGVFAKIIDSKQRGVYSEMTVVNRDGTADSFENTEECGLKHQEPDRWVHCGLITPAQLVEIALRQSQPNDAMQSDLAECVRMYEESVNEQLSWRRSVGISAEEATQVLERLKKGSVETLKW